MSQDRDQESTADTRVSEPFLWRFASCEFDERTGELRVNGEVVDLGGAPIRVLQELLRQPGHAIGRDDLLARVWKRSHQLISKNVLTNAIGRLRRALGDDAQRLIVTASGGGYLIQADVERVPLQPLVALDRLLKPGQLAPHRQHWKLREQIDATGSSQVWLASHEKTGENRVFKFAGDGFQLASLRREVTISRLLYAALGRREEFLRIADWNLDQPPYFIESDYGGYNLAQWIERQGGFAAVSIEARIDLAARLAEAVALAHSVGVLHKDLKPANVLVQDFEKGGTQLRVVDFGSGRLLEPEQLAAFQITHVSLPEADPSGTPFYIAPELLADEPASTASDIYALGVILFQLVVGDFRKPIASGWESDIADPILELDIREATQGSTSKRLKSAAELAERLRSLDTRRIEKADAVRQQNELEIVEGRLKRLKTVKPYAIAISAVVLISLIAITALFIRASRSAAEAKAQLAISQAVASFMNHDLVGQATPSFGGAPSIKFTDALSKAEQTITGRFADQPPIEAALRKALGTAWLGLNEFPAAENNLQRAVDLYGSMLKTSNSSNKDQVDYYSVLINLATTDIYLNNFAKADLLLTEARSYVDGPGSNDVLNKIEYLIAEGIRATEKSDAAKATEYYSSVISLAKASNVLDPVRFDSQLVMLASSQSRSGKPGEAAATAKAAGNDLEHRLGVTSLPTIQARVIEAISYTVLKDSESCIRVLTPTISELKNSMAADSQLALSAQDTLSACKFNMQLWAESAEVEKPVYEARIKKFGKKNKASIAIELNYATILTRTGDIRQALDLLEEAYSNSTELYGESNALTRVIAFSLADALLYDGKVKRAAVLLAPLTPEVLNTVSPADDWQGQIDYQEARIAIASNNNGDAKRLLERAIPVLNKANPPDFWMTMDAQKKLAEVNKKI